MLTVTADRTVILTAKVGEAAKTPARFEGVLLAGHAASGWSETIQLDGVALFDAPVPPTYARYWYDEPNDYELAAGEHWIAWRNLTYAPYRDRGAGDKEDAEKRVNQLGGDVYYSLNALLADWIGELRKREKSVYENLVAETLLNSKQLVELAGETVDLTPKRSVPAPKAATLILRGTLAPQTLDNLTARFRGEYANGLGVTVVPNLVPGMPDAYLVDPQPWRQAVKLATSGDLDAVAPKVRELVTDVRESLVYDETPIAEVVQSLDPVPVLPADDREAIATVLALMLEAPELVAQRRLVREVSTGLTRVMPRLSAAAIAAIAAVMRRLAAA